MALVGLSLGSVLGLAAAGDPSSDVPPHYRTASPHVGDRGEYVLVEVDETADPPYVRGDPVPLLRFEWQEPVDMYDAVGRPVRANQVYLEEWGRAHNSPDWHPMRKIHKYDAADGRLVAAHSANEASQDAEGNVESYFGSMTYFGPRTEPWHILCGLMHPLQARTYPLARPVPLFEGCDLDSSRTGTIDFYDGDPVSFRARGVEPLGGYDTVFFSGLKQNPQYTQRIYVWLAEQVPYPIRITIEHDDQPGVFDVIRLAGFERGAAPIAGPHEAPTLPPPPLLEFAPREPWGPRDDDAHHHFPLSHAWTWARDDPNATEFRTFLQTHPDAYTLKAHYQERWEDNVTVHRKWQWVTADATQWIRVGVDQVTRPLYRAVVPFQVDLLPGLADDVTYAYDNESVNLFGDDTPRPVPPEFVPAQWPTAASMLRVWDAYEGPELRTGNAWSFDLRCWFDCTQRRYLDLVLTAGQVEQHWENGPFYRSFVWSARSTLGFNSDGVVRYFYAQGPALGWEPQPAPALGAPARGLSTMEIPVWSFPGGRYAAATAFVALLAGAAYWAWPALKHAAFAPFFSRVQKPRALDQPVRAEIAHLIDAHPGIHFQEIVRRTGRGSGTVDHHLRKLVHVGLVAEQASSGYRCYFPKGKVDRRIMAAAPVLKADGAQRVLQEVLARPGTTASRIAQALGLTRQTVTYHVQRLAQHGLVAQTGEGRELRLAPTDLARQVVAALPAA